MEIVPLTSESITREILNILEQLAPTKKLSLKRAREILERQISSKHFTFVLYENLQAVAVGSIIIVEHMLHNGKPAAVLEDIAVHKDWQGKGYGKLMVKYLKKIARRYKVYKIILDCSDENIGFYEKLGFRRYHNQMRVDLIK